MASNKRDLKNCLPFKDKEEQCSTNSNHSHGLDVVNLVLLLDEHGEPVEVNNRNY